MAVEKKTVAKAATTKTPEVKAEAVKAEEKKVAAPAKAVAKKAPAKKAPAKKAAAPKKAEAKKVAYKEVTEVTLQFAEKEYTQDALVKIAKDVWKYDLKGKVSELKEIKLWVKPEESKVYYSLNGQQGSFDI